MWCLCLNALSHLRFPYPRGRPLQRCLWIWKTGTMPIHYLVQGRPDCLLYLLTYSAHAQYSHRR
mgnify:FL=1